jgi:probable phosphoglycerate mutase
MEPGNDAVRVLMVRHGETTWNAEDRLIGRTDLPLSEHGSEQAAQIAARLAGEHIDTIYASDMQRAAQTAAAIEATCGLHSQPDPRLRELDLGEWESLTYPDLERDFPDALAAWRGDPPVGPPGGEPPEHLVGRVRSFLDDLLARHKGETVALVSHGGVFQAMIFEAMGFPFRNDWQFYMFNGSISELWLNEGHAVLVRLNDTHHLDER